MRPGTPVIGFACLIGVLIGFKIDMPEADCQSGNFCLTGFGLFPYTPDSYKIWSGFRPRGLIKGKPVQFRHGPAAVIGDETRKMPLFHLQGEWEGAGSRRIRESEDLTSSPHQGTW